MSDNNDKQVGSEKINAALQVFSPTNTLTKYCLTETALIMPDGASFDTVEKIVKGMKIVSDRVRFWLGDLIIYAERNYGEMYSQLLDETDYSYQSLKDMTWVAGTVAPQNRRKELTWSHHREVSKLPQDKQQLYLEKAILNNLSVRALHRLIVEKEVADKPTPVSKVDAYEAALHKIIVVLDDDQLPDQQLTEVRKIAMDIINEFGA